MLRTPLRPIRTRAMSYESLNRAMKTSYSEFVRGIKGELPILLGVLPFGMIYGVAAISAGIPASIEQVMSFIVFAGSAQFVIVQLIAAGTPALSFPNGSLDVSLNNFRLIAGILAIVVALRTKNVLLTIFSGMACLLI